MHCAKGFVKTSSLVVVLASAAVAQAVTAYALTDKGVLLTFDTDAPQDVLSAHQVGSGLIGLDIRPSDHRLYAVDRSGAVYTIDPNTGRLGYVGGGGYGYFTPDLNGSRFGIDFDSASDTLRVVSDTDLNLRYTFRTNAEGGVSVAAVVSEGSLHYADGTNPAVTAIAYADSTLYGIDVRNPDRLVRADAASGLLTAIGPLGVNASALAGFDVASLGGGEQAFAVLQDTEHSSVSALYRIDLATGQAGRVDTIGGGDLIDGLAVGRAAVPEPASLVALALGVAGLLRRRKGA